MQLALVQPQEIAIQEEIGLDRTALDEFIEHRQEIKKPMTPLAIKKAKKFLLKYPESYQQHLVDHAILNGWRGLYHVEPPKRLSSRDTNIMDDLTDTSWAD